MNKSTIQVSDITFGWATIFAQRCDEIKSQPRPFSFSDPNLLPAMTAACLLVNFLDVITTSFGLCCSTGIGEGNAFANNVILRYGILGGITLLTIVKMGAPVGSFALLRSRKPGYRKALFAGLVANFGIVLFAVANNLMVLYNSRS